MKFGHFRRPQRPDIIAALYGMIVAQARSPTFYRAYGVPDTAAGRLELILLHIFLFCRRAGSKADAIRGLGQKVFDFFCRDMDGNLREMGVGDLAVPHHMRRIGESFYGRSAAYESALAAPEGRLAEALMRNVFSGQPRTLDAARRLAGYAVAADLYLARQADADLLQGRVSFPDPDSV